MKIGLLRDDMNTVENSTSENAENIAENVNLINRNNESISKMQDSIAETMEIMMPPVGSIIGNCTYFQYLSISLREHFNSKFHWLQVGCLK